MLKMSPRMLPRVQRDASPWPCLLVFAIAVFLVNAASAQDAICFEDIDGARWEIGLEEGGIVRGTVQIPFGGCQPGRVLGNYAFANATVPLHLVVPMDFEACVPRATMAATYTLGAGGLGQIIVDGILSDLPLLPCTNGALVSPAPGDPSWFSEPNADD